MPTSTHSSRVQTLRSLIQLLVDTSEAVIKEWEAQEQHAVLKESAVSKLPSHELFEARRVMRGACEMCLDLVEDPRHRVQELAETFMMSQAFDTTLRAGVPDILAEAEPVGGVSATDLSQRTGINEQKLVRVMRLLCCAGIYEEVETLHFANTDLSRVMVDNAGAVAIQRLMGLKLYVDAVGHMPVALLDPKWTNATAPNEAALQKLEGTNKTLWDYIERGDEADPVVREIREVFPISMVGQGQMGSPALVADFPWGSLGSATVVDVGGGVGSMCLDLAKAFPDLRFVVEDLSITIEKAKSVWSAEGANSVAARVQLLTHDFFTEQPIKGAAVYFLRCVLHDWHDDECVTILRALRDAMSTDSRILVADMVIHPPLGSPYLTTAPAPLPPNYGRAHAFTGMRDMLMLSLGNAMERTPEQLAMIANRAGLRLEKIWECRGPFSITELRLL
ncbi:S-adenosyl-L-methionine-dependent methyltransferase [Daedalea quercina L-15889]|uniref:S-adenosyl-L-methionine-dependent methyltransferase n=1 Tax=Daedalea quercina L-15889 TaxID=1314783 RepID=A0A165U0J2_9APHY|nr:S-adenosyl-L-methionine-dependent methyltransferase [Daedalea quercina L-15889]